MAVHFVGVGPHWVLSVALEAFGTLYPDSSGRRPPAAAQKSRGERVQKLPERVSKQFRVPRSGVKGGGSKDSREGALCDSGSLTAYTGAAGELVARATGGHPLPSWGVGGRDSCSRLVACLQQS